MASDKFEENAIFLCGHRKSGTTLLLSLLDSHTQLSVFPVDSGFFYKYYPICETKKYSTLQKTSTVIKEIIGNFENELQKLSEQERREINIDLEKFKNDFLYLARKTNLAPKDVLVSLSVSYKKNFKNSPNQIMWVEKTSSTEIYAIDVFNWFPNAKFIHVIRDPRDNWASLKSGWEKRYKKFNDSKSRLIQSLIDRGKLGMELARDNASIFGNNRYKIIKFEELVNKPEKTMKEICDFLGIKFEEIVLKPTICGKPWKGNNFDGIEFTSASSINVGRWKERISEDEAKLIEYYFADIMQFFGYTTEYDLLERVNAAKEHYKWYNYAQSYSYSTTRQKK